MAKHMTWRELATKIMSMDPTFLNTEAQVFINDSLPCVKHGYAGLWPIDDIVDAKGWNYEKRDYTTWGFITIGTEDEEE